MIDKIKCMHGFGSLAGKVAVFFYFLYSLDQTCISFGLHQHVAGGDGREAMKS